jgi:putative nucleotidyltransferase with HDIG domain
MGAEAYGMAEVEVQNQAKPLPWAFFRLSPFPQIALRVMKMVGKEDASMFKLAEVISSDPAFATELLTIANSPLFAPRYPATNILEAVSRLGTKNIQGICLTVAVRTYLGKSLNLPAMKLIWNHNLATALVSEQLALAFSLNKDDAYTAGIMHDIGRLAMASIKPHEYSELLGNFVGPAAAILTAEEQIFGFNHCEAGRQLTESWKLPHDFDAIVGRHHEKCICSAENADWPMEAIVHLSCGIADAIGFAAFMHCEPPVFAELHALLPERAANHFPAEEQLKELVGEKIRSVQHM